MPADNFEVDENTLPDLGNLGAKSNDELRQIAIDKGIKRVPIQRTELVIEVLANVAEETNQLVGAGILDLLGDGYGFLRTPGKRGGTEDIYVSQSQVRRFGLRQGDMIAGQVRPPTEGEKYFGLIRVELVNGYDPESAMKRPKFDQFTSIYPDEQIMLATTPKMMSTRMIDMVAPVGKGQRALIVAPPKAGKTVLLKQIAAGISENHPEIYIIVSLIGERPEEVTDMRRTIKGEVFSSTFDEPVEDHCRTAEVALDRARRLVESGENVVVLLDSLTRLARAYNLSVPSSGKTLSGGMDPNALYPPKRFFGAARNCEDAGSLTIVATALIDTGSRLDDLIYEEFKGTGNMELHLDRRMADRRLWPAIDIERSGTRHEELLQDESTLKQIWLLRRMMGIIGQDSNSPTEAAERILERMTRTQTNEEFLASITKPEKV
ncbi:MAG: transcription termination factor Rho [Chloroflexi bacterium]|nr:transcription termination factor Rho [Chloroflexota bacterium]MEE2840879.1 transcription termination factor Rho [Chloroflexota bacterium]